MPWELPQEDVDKAWGLINRKTRRWELREAGGFKLAIDEVSSSDVARALIPALPLVSRAGSAPRQISGVTV